MERPSYAAMLKEQMEHAPAISRSVSNLTFGGAARKEDEVDPELVAAVSYLGQFEAIHPTKATPGESLPEGYGRSAAGFLICNNVLEVQVDQEIVKKETERLRKFAVVAYFVEGRQSQATLAHWLEEIKAQIREWVGLGRDLGRGFFQLDTRQNSATQRLLMLTPHRSRWGTCILQSWVPGFNANRAVKMKVPTSIALRGIPGEVFGDECAPHRQRSPRALAPPALEARNLLAGTAAEILSCEGNLAGNSNHRSMDSVAVEERSRV